MTTDELNVKLTANSTDFSSKMKSANSSLTNFGSTAKSMSTSVTKGFNAIAAGLAATGIIKFAKASNEAYKTQLTQEIKLSTVMKQRTGATNEQVQSVKALASEQQKIGIIGDEVQLAGAQQIATFATQTSTIEELIPAMNNLLAQQNGYNSTTSDAVSVANLMGKALQGQTSALTRVGITFTEAQENVLKYGSEEERAAMLSEVITDNVGEMNQALRNTPTGEMTALANDFGDLQEQIGASFQPLIESVVPMLSQALADVQPFISGLTTGFSMISSALNSMNPEMRQAILYTVAAATAFKALSIAGGKTFAIITLLGLALTYLMGTVSDTEQSAADSVSDAMAGAETATQATTDSVDGLSDSMSEASKVATKLAGFDEITKLSGGGSSTVASQIATAEDIANIEDATIATKGLQSELNGIGANLNLDQALDNLVKKVQTGELGKNIMRAVATAITGETDTKVLDTAFENMFSDVFSGNWKSFSENIAKGAAQDDFIKGMFSMVSGVKDDETLSNAAYDMYNDIFGGNWGEFWGHWYTGFKQSIGQATSFLWETWQKNGNIIYQLTHPGEIETNDLNKKYNTTLSDIRTAIANKMRNGINWAEAMNQAKSEYLTTPEAVYWYEEILPDSDKIKDADVIQMRQNLIDGGEIPSSDIAEPYSAADVYDAFTAAMNSSADWRNGGVQQYDITIDIDGEAVGKAAATYQNGQVTVTNGRQ